MPIFVRSFLLPPYWISVLNVLARTWCPVWALSRLHINTYLGWNNLAEQVKWTLQGMCLISTTVPLIHFDQKKWIWCLSVGNNMMAQIGSLMKVRGGKDKEGIWLCVSWNYTLICSCWEKSRSVCPCTVVVLLIRWSRRCDTVAWKATWKSHNLTVQTSVV